jgi:hypothetical protein
MKTTVSKIPNKPAKPIREHPPWAALTGVTPSIKLPNAKS